MVCCTTPYHSVWDNIVKEKHLDLIYWNEIYRETQSRKEPGPTAMGQAWPCTSTAQTYTCGHAHGRSSRGAPRDPWRAFHMAHEPWFVWSTGFLVLFSRCMQSGMDQASERQRGTGGWPVHAPIQGRAVYGGPQ